MVAPRSVQPGAGRTMTGPHKQVCCCPFSGAWEAPEVRRPGAPLPGRQALPPQRAFSPPTLSPILVLEHEHQLRLPRLHEEMIHPAGNRVGRAELFQRLRVKPRIGAVRQADHRQLHDPPPNKKPRGAPAPIRRPRAKSPSVKSSDGAARHQPSVGRPHGPEAKAVVAVVRAEVVPGRRAAVQGVGAKLAAADHPGGASPHVANRVL